MPDAHVRSRIGRFALSCRGADRAYRDGSFPSHDPRIDDIATAAPFARPVLRNHVDGAKHVDAFTPTAQRDDLDRIVEAQREAARAARAGPANEWIAKGGPRHSKYQR